MKVEFRPYQKECCDNVKADLELHNKLLCVAPTGSGKTFMFGSIVKDYLNDNPTKRVMVLSHLGLLTKQTGDSFKEFWNVDSEVLQAQEIPTTKARCIIGTMQSTRNEDKIDAFVNKMDIWRRSKDALEVNLIIVDEMQRMGSASYNKIFDMFPDAKVIGFSATPLRENKLMTNMFDKVSFTISMQELIDQGYLVPPKLHLVQIDQDDIEDVYAKVVNTYITNHKGEYSIVFMRTKQQAADIRNIFDGCGIPCAAVTSDLTGAYRDEVLNEFKNETGKYMVLTTVDVLTAGFDAPCTKSIFMPFKIRSVVAYLQRVGRGLRIKEGKTHCDIYCGSSAPMKEEGYWEKMEQTMLKHGQKEYDTVTEELEYMDDHDVRYEWTEETVQLIKQAKKAKLNGIAHLIDTKEFPSDLLDIMREEGVGGIYGARVKSTPEQKKYLIEKKILDKDDVMRLNRDEAINTIYAHKRSEGWEPRQCDVVQAGPHRGKMYGMVPKIYWRFVKAYSIKKGYLDWKKRTGN